MYRIDFHLPLQMKFYLSVHSDNCKKANLAFHVFLKHRSCHYRLNYNSYNKTILLPQFRVTSSILYIRHQCLTNGSFFVEGWVKKARHRKGQDLHVNKAECFGLQPRRILVSVHSFSWTCIVSFDTPASALIPSFPDSS